MTAAHPPSPSGITSPGRAAMERQAPEPGRRRPEGAATPSDRPELSSMADDYAWYALSQHGAFEATHRSALATARLFADERILRVADLGAADGVNSHGLIRALAEQRAGRPLIYALVDLPTNAWGVAGEHLRHAFGQPADGSGVVVIPAPGDAGPGVADAGTGAHYASPDVHGEACRRAVEQMPPPATVISTVGIPLQRAPCLPSGSVHVAVTGTAMHWVADAAGLESTGSVFPGYPDHMARPSGEPGAWPQRMSGSGCSRPARWSSQRAGGSLPRSLPRPHRAPRGRGST